jgi:hypothetical protein
VLYLAEKYPEKGFLPRERARWSAALAALCGDGSSSLSGASRVTHLSTDRFPADVALGLRLPRIAAVLGNTCGTRIRRGRARGVADFVMAYTSTGPTRGLLDGFPRCRAWSACTRVARDAAHRGVRSDRGLSAPRWRVTKTGVEDPGAGARPGERTTDHSASYGAGRNDAGADASASGRRVNPGQLLGAALRMAREARVDAAPRTEESTRSGAGSTGAGSSACPRQHTNSGCLGDDVKIGEPHCGQKWRVSSFPLSPRFVKPFGAPRQWKYAASTDAELNASRAARQSSRWR